MLLTTHCESSTVKCTAQKVRHLRDEEDAMLVKDETAACSDVKTFGLCAIGRTIAAESRRRFGQCIEEHEARASPI
jgi:hypothetical protein